MALLNNADAIYFGHRPVDRVCLGTQRVWPPLTLTEQVRQVFAGRLHGMYDFTLPSSLYQDAAGTMPVDAFGQPIGLVMDVGGTEYHLSQPTTAARPTYTEQGALHDGVDDFLQADLAEDWAFLHDGTGGTLGVCGSWGGVGGNGVSGTQESASNSVGTSLGLQSSATSRGYWRTGDGSAVVAASSASGTWPDSGLKRLLLSYAAPTILRWDDGIRQSDLDASGLAPSVSPPSNPLRTIIAPANGANHFRRRIIALTGTIIDPAEIALLDAWLREGE